MSIPIPVARVDHIGVMVGDLDAALRWYTDTLGFTVTDQWANPDAEMSWAHLELAGMRIEFVQRPGLAPELANGAGYHHVALVVADCANAVNELISAGATEMFAPSYFERHDMDWSFVRDPFGNILELISYRNPTHPPDRP